MYSTEAGGQKSRCFRCSHEFLRAEGRSNPCPQCGSSEVFPSLSSLQPNFSTVNNSGSLQPLTNFLDSPLPSYSAVLPPFTSFPPLSSSPQHFTSNSTPPIPHSQFSFPPLVQPPFPQITDHSKQSLPSMLADRANVINNNNNTNDNIPINKLVNNNINNNNFSANNNTVGRGNGTEITANNNIESNQNKTNNQNMIINNNNNNTERNNNVHNQPINNNTSVNNTQNSSGSDIVPQHHRILQTVHLQHIQNLIEIQRTMHLQNPPYPQSHSPDIARIVNEINTVMHNHSLQHFQALSSALHENRNIHNAHFETLFPSNHNDNNEMSSQEYSQILADLFERQQGHSGPPPTDKSELLKLPQLIFTEEDLKDEKQCAVCKELFQEDDTAVELPCNHPFHLDCILPWLKTRNTCPCCRYQLKPAEETQSNQNNDTNMSDSDDEGVDADGDYEIADSESDFSSDDGEDSNTFTTSYVYNN